MNTELINTLTLPLEPTDDLAKPVFRNVGECTAWLAQLQLTNLQPAHDLLLVQINEFNRFPMRGLDRLNTLELLCETVNYVQDNFAKKLISKPLPLNDNEMQVFVAIVSLWQAMVLGYQRCLQSHLAGDQQLANRGALLCQRCLRYSGLAIFEHLRSGYDFDAELWHQMHELYAFSERSNFNLEMVTDPLNTVQPNTNCQSVYVKILLACYAHPAELNRSQLQLLEGWLSVWSCDLSVAKTYATSRSDAQPLAVDLASKHGLRPLQHIDHNETTRYIALIPLSKLLRVKTILLQQGQTPKQQGLGDSCNNHDCIEFLIFLHKCWCEEANARFGERHPVEHKTQLSHTPAIIFSFLSGKPLKSSESQSIGTPGQSNYESWQFENESILGARLIREKISGGRLGYNQLVALHSNAATASIVDGSEWVLGATTWVNITITGKLRVGVRYLPGAVEAVFITINALENEEIFPNSPAFLLQAVPALKTPPSLIVPRGSYKPGRIADITHLNAEKKQIKMGICVERGMDYERVSFTQV